MIRLTAQNSYQTKLNVEGKEVYRFQVTDDRINRNGWKTITNGIDYKEFLDNPVILWDHDLSKPAIGKALNIIVKNNAMFVDIWFHEETRESKEAKLLVDIGVLAMTSITIQPTKRGQSIPISEKDRSMYPWWMDVIEVYEESTLLEVSIVNIPANAGSKLKEKIESALKDNILLKSDWELIKANFMSTPEYFIDSNNSNNQSIQFTNSESSMTFEELQRQHITLQADLAVSQKEKASLDEENSKLKASVADLQKANSEAQANIEELTATTAQTKADLEKSNTQLAEQRKQLIETQVEADILALAEFITPADNGPDNNYKLKRDLTHLKLNEATQTDADGKPLYQARIAEIKSRKSINYLKKELETTGKPSEAIDLLNFDYANPQHQAAATAEAKELAAKEKIPFADAYEQILDKYERAGK